MKRFLVFLALGGCASVGGYDMSKVQSDLNQTLTATETVVEKSQTDFAEKTALVDNLKKTLNPSFAEIEPRLRGHLERMTASLEAMKTNRKSMRDASGNLASLAYSHEHISARDDEYGRVQDAIGAYQTAAKNVNGAVVDYSRESNTLADLIAQKKLFYNFDVREFQRRVQQAIKTAQSQSESMQGEVTRGQDLLNNWNRPEVRPAAEDAFNRMVRSASDYNTKAQSLGDISREMNGNALGAAKMSTLDAGWPAAQTTLSKFDRTVNELRELSDEFLRANEAFRNPKPLR